jgi:predicted DNA-binding transcriptional regulator AlpA
MSDIVNIKNPSTKTAKNEVLHYGELPKHGFIRTRHLLPVLDISRATLSRWIKSGIFPKPITLGQKITAFKVEDVRAFLDSQGAA